MEGNNLKIKKEQCWLKTLLYLHFFSNLFILGNIIFIIIDMKIIKKIYKDFFIISIIVYIILIFFPIHSLILLYKNKLYSKIVNLYKKLSLIAFFIIFVFIILIIILFVLNYLDLSKFYHECEKIDNIFKKRFLSQSENNDCLILENNFRDTTTYLCDYNLTNKLQSLNYEKCINLFTKVNESNYKNNCKLFNKSELNNQNSKKNFNYNFYNFSKKCQKKTYYECILGYNFFYFDDFFFDSHIICIFMIDFLLPTL